MDNLKIYSSERLRIVLNGANIAFPVIKSTSTKKFVYTLDNDVMTEAQRAFYEENGFLVIRNLVDHALLNDCKERFIDLCNGKIAKGQLTLMKDKSLMKTNAKGEYLYYKAQDILWDDVFFKYMKYPKITEYVKCFTGPNITAISLMLINKPPDSGKLTSVHPLHQDLHYFPFRPADRIVASWTAIEKATVDNGCLFVIPGTHKSSLQPHDYPETDINKAYHGIPGFDLVPRVNLEMEKGDTVFFHPLLMHGSGPNLTKGFRKAMTGHYASSDCYYIDVKGTTQDNIAAEVETMAKKRGLNLTFQQTYEYRKRLLKGRKGRL